MEDKLKDLRQLLCLFLAIITLFSIFPTITLADDEHYGGTDEEYYVSSRDELKQIFNLDIQKAIIDTALGYIKGGAAGAGIAITSDALNWLSQKYTFVVVKKYKDKGQTKTKIYVNAPNIQQLIQNVVLGRVPGGWDSRMWTPGDNLITDVGKADAVRAGVSTNSDSLLFSSGSENVMTKFGFNLPVPLYEGEYPAMYMSMNNVIPTKWYQVLWRFIKSLFGFSFINPPDDENFKTLGYWGNLYTDVQNEQLIQYVQKNWLRMESLLFYNGKAGVEYFGHEGDGGLLSTTAYDCLELATTTNEYNAACEYIYETLVYRQIDGRETSKLENYFVDVEDIIMRKLLYFAVFKDVDTFLNAPAGDIKYSLEVRKNDTAWEKWRNLKNPAVASLNDSNWIHAGTSHNKKETIKHEDLTAYATVSNYIKNNPDANEFHINFELGQNYGEEVEYTFTAAAFGPECLKNQTYRDKLETLFPGMNEAQAKYIRIREQIALCEQYYEQDLAAWNKEKTEYDAAYAKYEKAHDYWEKEEMPAWKADCKKWNNLLTGKASVYTIKNAFKKWKTWYINGGKSNLRAWKEYMAKYYCAKNKLDFETDLDGDLDAQELRTWRDKYYPLKKDSSGNYTKKPTRSSGKFFEAYSIYKKYGRFPTDPQCEPDEPQPPPYPEHYDPENRHDSDKKAGKPLKKDYYLDPNYEGYLELPAYYDIIPDSAKNMLGWTTNESFVEDVPAEPTYSSLYLLVKGSDSLGSDKDEDDIKEDIELLIKGWNDCRKLQSNYRKFNRLMNNGTEHVQYQVGDGVRKIWKLIFGDGERDNKYIYFSQCLLNVKDPPDNSVENCKKVYGETTVYLTLFHYYITSGAWRVTKTDDGKYFKNKYFKNGEIQWNTELEREDAIRIILCLQTASGPAMEEGWKNLIKVFEGVAAEHGVTVVHDYVEDNRIMPYDRTTLINSDKNIITVYDPRVEIYKNQSFIGGIITGWHFNLLEQIVNQPTIFEWFSNLVGKITKLTVFINSLCSFEFIEKADLSPTTMWKKFSSALIISLLMAILIVQIIILTLKFIRGKAGFTQILGKVILFLLILAIMAAAFFMTNSTLNAIKRVVNVATNLGETMTLGTEDNIQELYGDGRDKGSVNYYLPYFNLWAKFMTGHGLTENAAIIKGTSNGTQYTSDYFPESDGMIAPSIVVGGTRTRLWAVALADSFNKLGENLYVVSLQGINGNTVNKNAYRVVDHFLAPRLRVTNPGALKDGSLYIENKDNENYNGKFQNMDILTMISGVLTVINLLIIVVIKFLTFLYMWYMLYILIFNVLLSSVSPQGDGFKLIILKTFSPILFLILIGLYAGLVIKLSFITEGFLGIIINIGIFFATGILLSAWKNTRVFPGTLTIIYALFHPVVIGMGMASWTNERKKAQDEQITGRKFEDNLAEDGKLIYTDEQDIEQATNGANTILLKARRGESLTEKERLFVQNYQLQNAIDNGCESIEEYKRKLELTEKDSDNKQALTTGPDDSEIIKHQFWYSKENIHTSARLNKMAENDVDNTDSTDTTTNTDNISDNEQTTNKSRKRVKMK